jgi:hypothetical protein
MEPASGWPEFCQCIGLKAFGDPSTGVHQTQLVNVLGRSQGQQTGQSAWHASRRVFILFFSDLLYGGFVYDAADSNHCKSSIIGRSLASPWAPTSCTMITQSDGLHTDVYVAGAPSMWQPTNRTAGVACIGACLVAATCWHCPGHSCSRLGSVWQPDCATSSLRWVARVQSPWCPTCCPYQHGMHLQLCVLALVFVFAVRLVC